MKPLNSNRIAKLGLVVFTGLLALTVLSGGNTHRPGAIDNDVANGFHIWADFLHRWFQRGIFPFWNPHAFHGYPAFETLQNTLTYPPALAAWIFFPPGLALNAILAFHLVLGLTGTWHLTKTLRYHPLACLLTSILFMTSGVIAVRMTAGHITVISVMSLWPWAIAGWIVTLQILRRSLLQSDCLLPLCLDRSNLLRGPILTIVALAAAIKAGAPQYVAYLGYILFFWGVAWLILQPKWSPRKLHQLKPAYAFVLYLSLFVGFAACLAAPLLLPALAYLPFSGRGTTRWTLFQPLNLFDARFAFLETFLPLPLGDDVSRPHIAPSNVWETSLYLGTAAPGLVFGLILAGGFAWFFRQSSPTARRILIYALPVTILTVLALVLIQGLNLPGLARFRDPLKARAILHLALALGTGAALTLLFRLPDSPFRKFLLFGLSLPILVSAVLLSWAFLHPQSLGTSILPSQGPFDLLASREFSLHKLNPALVGQRILQATLYTLPLLLGIGMALIRFRRNHVMAIPVSLVIITVLAADAISPHSPCFVPLQPYATNSLSDAVRDGFQQIEQEQISEGQPFRVTLPGRMANRAAYLDMIYDTAGYDPLMPTGATGRGASAHAVSMNLNSDPTVLPERQRRSSEALGRRYDWINVPPRYRFGTFASDWPAFSKADGLVLANAPQARIFSLHQQAILSPFPDIGFGPNADGLPILQDHVRPLGRINGQPFHAKDHPRTRSFLDQLKSASTFPPLPLPSVDLPPASPNRWTLHFPSPIPHPTLLIARITNLPGWRYRALPDPTWQSPLLANGWAMGIPIPPGTTQVELFYRPARLTPGLLLSLLCAIALLILIFRATPTPSPSRP